MNLARLARATGLGVSLAALAASASLAATAAPPATAAAPPAPAKAVAPVKKVVKPAAPKGVVEPGAAQALRAMSAYLRTLPTFKVTMTTERDEVDDFGQLLTFTGETTYQVKLPDAFAIDVVEGSKTRQYVYDGKSVTMYDPVTGYYAVFKAPPTIRATLDAAADKYGITVPFDDLFHRDQDEAQEKALTSGHYVGTAKVNGQDAEQYAFRQAGVDWQIWLAKGDKPAPLRVVIVASDDPARPQFEANLAWDTAAQFAADTFVFTPPANAKMIPLRTAGQ
jgi:hypothetical protein